MSDIIRVLRVVEYTGDRSVVEETVSRSIHGEHKSRGMIIRVATIGTYPEILEDADDIPSNED